ncbi:DNA translocase FtsK [Peribacillus sp. NPDC097295]|uniref:DNA translocase FtsK n=1 Tax=Peribacillus sp. NPDC097295 TaxID=3364402 RepID=UPI003816CDD0
MKWLNKMKKWFQAEEIIEIEEIIIDEPIDEETLKTMDFSKLPKTKKEEIEAYNQTVAKMSQIKDPDTKILFQYPKGEFKFPLIPDKEKRERKPREKRREDGEHKQEKDTHESKRPLQSPELKRKNAERIATQKIIPSNTPFRPTEIPSPVYGFRRPEKKVVKSVEYELESKLPVLKKEAPAQSYIPNDIKEAPYEELTLEPTVLVPEQIEEKKEEAITEIPAYIRRNMENDPEETNEPEVSIAEQPLKQDAIQPGTGHMEFGQEVAVGIMEPVVTPDEVPLEEAKPAYIEEQATVAPVLDEEVEPQPEEIPIRKKKHIPFNVMMLKQDREKTTFLNSLKTEKKSLETERAVVSVERKPAKKPETARAMEEDELVPDATEVQVVENTVQQRTDTTEPQKTEESHDEPVKTMIREGVSTVKTNEGPVIPIIPEVNDMAHEEREGMVPREPMEDKPAIPEPFETLEEEENPYYVFPKIELLTPPTYAEHDDEWLEEQTVLLDETLKNFNVRAKVVNVTQGPAVTRFEVHPEPGVKVNKVTNLMDDIKLSLAAQDMRMEAPIPGKHTIGIEIPNRKSKPVFLREVLESTEFQEHESPLAVALGLDISGQPIITDLRKMPHGLIAGQTGSGKSVCINTMLVSLLYKATPQELKLLLIDPKMVELAPYNQIPHLVSPVITDVKAATAALKWAVEEMERRYELFVHAGVRDISRFNDQAEKAGQYSNKLPYILVIIDELADLMMMSPADVEEAICRIAQKARACGIHLIVATQRPSVDVITGLIKANIPTRIAFSVSSQVDSRTIIDSGGAEKLLGRGDMLFAENGSSKTVRLQGTFVSDEEIDQVVNHVKLEQKPKYLFEQEDLLNRAQVTEEADELFFEACEFVVHQQAASASSVQRRFRVGYNRAARLIEMMEQQGVVSESRGSRPRDVLITEEELEFLHVN